MWKQSPSEDGIEVVEKTPKQRWEQVKAGKADGLWVEVVGFERSEIITLIATGFELTEKLLARARRYATPHARGKLARKEWSQSLAAALDRVKQIDTLRPPREKQAAWEARLKAMPSAFWEAVSTPYITLNAEAVIKIQASRTTSANDRETLMRWLLDEGVCVLSYTWLIFHSFDAKLDAVLQKYASVQTQPSVGTGSSGSGSGSSGSSGSGGGGGGDGQGSADSKPEMMYRPRPSRITRKRKGSRSASAAPAKRLSVASSLRRSTRGEGSVLKGRVVKVQWGGKWYPATVADVDGRGLRVRWKDGSSTDYKADEVEEQVRAPKGAEPLDFSSMRELVEIARRASSM